MRKPLKPPPIFDGERAHAECEALKLRIVSYQERHITVDGGNWWIPRDVIGRDGKTLILWRKTEEAGYAVDGWHPWHDGMFGGCYATFDAALAWVRRAREIRAGTATDFRGV